MACRDTWRWSYTVFCLSGVVQTSCCVASLSFLRLGLGSIGGQQSGSLFCRASALQNSPAASYASAICSVTPLAPVAPTLRAPRVLAGGGPVGPAVLLIWEGISRGGQESHFKCKHATVSNRISNVGGIKYGESLEISAILFFFLPTPWTLQPMTFKNILRKTYKGRH